MYRIERTALANQAIHRLDIRGCCEVQGGDIGVPVQLFDWQWQDRDRLRKRR